MERLRNVGIPAEGRTLGNVLRLKAKKNGDKTFLRFLDRSYSYKEFNEISNRLAHSLTSVGIEKGQHVAFMMDNKPEILLLYFAVAKIGAVSVPVNTAAKGELLAYYLTQSDSTALIADSGLVDRFVTVQEQCSIDRVIVVDDGRPLADDIRSSIRGDVTDYEALLDGSAEDLPVDIVRNRDLAFLLYTSGTTGPSKGNMEPHEMMVSGSIDYAEYYGYQPEDVIYTCLPLFHGNALNTSALPALMADATLVVSPRFSASAFWQEVRDNDVTQFNLLGAMANIIWAQPESPKDRENKVRMCMMVPVPDFAREFEKRYELKITSVYALTDFGGATFLSPEHPPAKWKSAGELREHMTIAIMDDDDQPQPTGTPGEICLRCDVPWMTAQGYYKKPDATAEARRNLWFHTGDRGYMDEDGFLYFVDRKKDAIRRRGENISSYEVEQIILGHPAVEDVAAYAVNSEMSEDEVMVSVECKEGHTLNEEELVRYCADNMAYFMVPRFVEFVSELPRTMTEKVEKYKLKQDAQERLGQIWDREEAGIVVNRYTN
ncbi:ATP-dependent acyl-CoA ligase [uncultured Sneathiella sp.]|uniref:ATP-dependent acyl-CoA ligase n=1 Tax=uncultured Sneathiella sp. TaxID=879315 RepID=UPI0030EEAA42|tara:strand:- start:41833 stop:43473 length:1641 start_codon:yes stop_codon:yes gene_type:complete